MGAEKRSQWGTAADQQAYLGVGFPEEPKAAGMIWTWGREDKDVWGGVRIHVQISEEKHRRDQTDGEDE